MISLQYFFSQAAIFLASLLLFLYFVKTSKLIALVVSMAIFSWFLGAFFWISYVFILGNMVGYPSIVELAYQNFDLLMIPTLLRIMREKDIRVLRPSLAFVALISSIPSVALLFSPVPANVVLYSSFFLFLVSLDMTLAANMLAKMMLPLLSFSVILISMAHLYVVVLNFYCHSCFVLFLEPLWFSGFTLTSFSMIRHLNMGEL